MRSDEISSFRVLRTALAFFMTCLTVGAGTLAVWLFRDGQYRLALGMLFMLAVLLGQSWRFWRGYGEKMEAIRDRMKEMRDYIDAYHRGEVPPSRPESQSRIEELRAAIHRRDES